MEKNNNEKYNKLLNNLLSINTRDQAIFTKINGVNSFDVSTKFSPSVAKKIIDKKLFAINLEEKDITLLISEINKTDDPLKIVNLFNYFKISLSRASITLLNNINTFYETKEKLLNKLKLKKQQEIIRWQQFRRQVIDINVQENVWPLHIGTLFISMRTEDNKVIYAPFLLKEVSLEISQQNIKLKSENNWFINEKLEFLLADFEISKFKNDIDFDNENLYEIISKICRLLKINKESPFNLHDKFVNKIKGEIKNNFIEIFPGIVLGLFKPSGGKLRKMMQQIIESNDIDSILDPYPDKTIYNEKVNEQIENGYKNLIKIQKSNFSQDKALISALIQDTIIWGPPGTGKSQVIANVIANVFYNNKTAIVMSQKKAALDVLQKRLRKIAPFALFILNDKNMDKSEFYKPLIEFINVIETAPILNEKNNNQIFNNIDIEFLAIINKFKNENKYQDALKLLKLFKNSKHIFEDGFYLNKEIVYPNIDNQNLMYSDKYSELIMKQNNISYKRKFFFKKIPDNIKKSSTEAKWLFDNTKIQPEVIKNAIMNFSESDIKMFNVLIKKNIIKFENHFFNDEDFLKNFIVKRIKNKFLEWSKTKKYNEYKKFANAIRASRRIPHKFINDHILIIKDLFPIIITTPQTGFVDLSKKKFDYAILDESSQMFLEVGLPILYSAKIKILAGDQKQMRPSQWFSTRYDIDYDELIEDVVENADSLLDYAMDKGVYEVMLDQNYRSSHASLMSFSSKIFYDSKLGVVDNLDKRNIAPIEVINVNGYWASGINIVEASKVIQIANKEIDNFDSIIILAFNSKQRQIIEKEILERNIRLYQALEDGKLSIKNIENIQGDEADLVIMSIVYDENTKIGGTYVARSGGMNALNVAISRAKDKLIVIKSISYDKLKLTSTKDCFVFKEWLKFLDLNCDEQKKYSQTDDDEKFQIIEEWGDIDSNFEADVIDLIKKNIKTKMKALIVKQYEVGSYKIDIAIIEAKTRKFVLGIEVDGYKYHHGIQKFLKDKSRQNFIESKGYKIYRIKEIDFQINKPQIVNEISALLNEYI